MNVIPGRRGWSEGNSINYILGYLYPEYISVLVLGRVGIEKCVTKPCSSYRERNYTLRLYLLFTFSLFLVFFTW